MMGRLVVLFLLVSSLAPYPVSGQGLPPGHSRLERETDPAVASKLEWFQDIKLGLLIHWGPYSQWGIVESWSICSEDVPWCARPKGIGYTDYKKKYEALKTTFNPKNFNPDRWADTARSAGMRYVIFYAKHHDGFSMFDTRLTDYRITDPGCPFHDNPRADVAREIFKAFRSRGMGIAAGFSKPDWHSTDYWAPEWATPDRNVNYDTARYPERWKRFTDFTYGQVEELMSGYRHAPDRGHGPRPSAGPDHCGPHRRRPLRKLRHAGADYSPGAPGGSLGNMPDPGHILGLYAE
jgi:alpha-L-fucosidase